jgi:hypothetical protein
MLTIPYLNELFPPVYELFPPVYELFPPSHELFPPSHELFPPSIVTKFLLTNSFLTVVFKQLRYFQESANQHLFVYSTSLQTSGSVQIFVTMQPV